MKLIKVPANESWFNNPLSVFRTVCPKHGDCYHQTVLRNYQDSDMHVNLREGYGDIGDLVVLVFESECECPPVKILFTNHEGESLMAIFPAPGEELL